MAVTNFLSTIWSKMIIANLDRQSVVGDICNRNYEGDASNNAVVKVPSIVKPTISPYTRNSSVLVYEDIDGSTQDLNIDQSHSFSFYLDDCDKAQMGVPDLQAATASAALGMVDVIDQYVLNFHKYAGIQYGDIAINSSNVNEVLAHCARLLDEENNADGGRWLVAPPWLVEKMRLAKIVSGTDNSAVLENGIIGNYLGFSIRKSTNVDCDSTDDMVLFGLNNAISLVIQINSVEAIRLEGSFSDAVRGLLLFGSKVIVPLSLGCLHCSEIAEAGV